MERRAFDVAACNPSLKVTLNGMELPSSFSEYVELFRSPKEGEGEEEADNDAEGDTEGKDTEENSDEKKEKLKDRGIVFAKLNDRWQIAVGVTPIDGQFAQMSFVNSIATSKGGTHVSYVTDQIVKGIHEKLSKRNSDLELKPAHVRNQLFVFVNCLIENPSFDSQVSGEYFVLIKPYILIWFRLRTH
jgi:DNA topoisomerase II